MEIDYVRSKTKNENENLSQKKNDINYHLNEYINYFLGFGGVIPLLFP